MKDRFKFRVWNKREDCYIEPPQPTPLLQSDGVLAYFSNNPEAMNFYDIEFCTGLKDKNGNLIYEGDLIKSPNNSNLLEVIWEESSWHTKEYKPNGKNELILDSLVAFYGVEIVGNIHEKEE